MKKALLYAVKVVGVTVLVYTVVTLLDVVKLIGLNVLITALEG